MTQNLKFARAKLGTAFNGFAESFSVTNHPEAMRLHTYLVELEAYLEQFIGDEVERRHGVKVFPILHAWYERKIAKDDSLQQLFPIAAPTMQIHNSTQVHTEFAKMAQSILSTNDTLLKDGSLKNFDHAERIELHIADFDPFNKSARSKAELPEFLFK